VGTSGTYTPPAASSAASGASLTQEQRLDIESHLDAMTQLLKSAAAGGKKLSDSQIQQLTEQITQIRQLLNQSK
jgi:hypothetical protein